LQSEYSLYTRLQCQKKYPVALAVELLVFFALVCTLIKFLNDEKPLAGDSVELRLFLMMWWLMVLISMCMVYILSLRLLWAVDLLAPVLMLLTSGSNILALKYYIPDNDQSKAYVACVSFFTYYIIAGYGSSDFIRCLACRVLGLIIILAFMFQFAF